MIFTLDPFHSMGEVDLTPDPPTFRSHHLEMGWIYFSIDRPPHPPSNPLKNLGLGYKEEGHGPKAKGKQFREGLGGMKDVACEHSMEREIFFKSPTMFLPKKIKTETNNSRREGSVLAYRGGR
jgi:hypothetical protein